MDIDFFCGGCDHRRPLDEKRMKNNLPRCVHCMKKTLKGTAPKVEGGPLTQKGSANQASNFVPYREIT